MCVATENNQPMRAIAVAAALLAIACASPSQPPPSPPPPPPPRPTLPQLRAAVDAAVEAAAAEIVQLMGPAATAVLRVFARAELGYYPMPVQEQWLTSIAAWHHVPAAEFVTHGAFADWQRAAREHNGGRGRGATVVRAAGPRQSN